MTIIALAVGMLPCLLWLWCFSAHDRYSWATKVLVLQAYGLGILCGIPTLWPDYIRAPLQTTGDVSTCLPLPPRAVLWSPWQRVPPLCSGLCCLS